MKTKRFLTIQFILILLYPAGSLAYLGLSGRAIGLAGSYIAMARGADAPRWNPANLGLSDNPEYSYKFLSFGLYLGNNSFSTSLYNSYFTTGDSLTYQDKLDIMDNISKDGLILNLNTRLDIFNFSAGRFAFSLSGVEAFKLSFAKEYLSIALLGNVPERDYRFETTGGAGWTGLQATFSYAWPLRLRLFREFAVGGNLSYFRGFYYADAMDTKGHFIVLPDSSIFNTEVNLYTATGGDGISVDLGMAGVVNDRWAVGLVLFNVFGRVIWDSNVRKIEEVVFLNTNLARPLEDIYGLEESSRKISYTTSKFPVLLRAGVRYVASETTVIAGDIEEGFSTLPGVTYIPRFSCGVDYQWQSWLPLRVGGSIGGLEGFELAFGFGLKLPRFVFDFGIAGIGGVGNGAQGIKLGIDLVSSM
ncbi:hypothetical protein ISS37_02205 [candidate division KSB1 bacterium]|nr:hypothetical protein [candidate division KSB1 bacterium]